MTKKVTITLDERVVKELLKLAKRDHRSLSALINHLLSMAIETKNS